ncbi:MAG: hypothetical protein GXO26_03865 [Crenarchaeota archaeon]|nr:hypothetical protein [Thermoproteota archaeon]
MLPIIAVVGFKNSGKTLIISEVCRKLSREGIKILPIKHIPHKDFTMLKDKKDTTILYENCRSTGYVADSGEIGMIIKEDDIDIIDFSIKIRSLFNYDLIMLEGFSRKVLNNDKIIKIICLRSIDELKDFQSEGVSILCSLNIHSKEIIKIPEEINIVINFVRNFLKVYKIYERLPRLDCGRCGLTCWRMAELIFRGSRSFNDCLTLQDNVKVVVNGVEIPLNDFVRKLCSNIILGLLKSLKGVPDDVRYVRIELRF